MKTIAIVGRPNVGKSRLFNRIIGRRYSIVEDTPGVTRDRVEFVHEDRGESIRWIDTGGIGLSDDEASDGLAEMIALQADVAIEAADSIIFVVDAETGLTPLDKVVATRLRGGGKGRAKSTHLRKKPIVVAMNKADHADREHAASDFISLGMGEVFSVSAEHGRGIEDLVERAIALCVDLDTEHTAGPPMTRVTIVGRPNVGKSSLLNAILGTERVIVSPVPGTTRDAIEAAFELDGGIIALVDTAGIRKKRATSLLESVMVGRTRKALERSDVGIVVIDAIEGITEQDIKILAAVLSLGKAAVIALNKWDAAPSKAFDKVAADMRRKLGAAHHVPIVSISALKNQRIRRLLDVALEVGRNAETRIKTSELNRILSDVAMRAPSGVKIKYGIQKSIMPPSFVIFGSGRPQESLLGFIRNSIRSCGTFDGVPIVVDFRK